VHVFRFIIFVTVPEMRSPKGGTYAYSANELLTAISNQFVCIIKSVYFYSKREKDISE